MRVLIVSQWYAPEPAVRVTELAEALVAAGHKVTVVTGFPNYPTGRVYPGYRIRRWQRERRNGVDVLRLPLYPDQSRSVFRRAANYLSFAASAMGLAPCLVGRADVVWGYTMVVGPAALWLSWTRNAPLLLDIPDLWPDTVTSTGMVADGPWIRMLGAACTYVYRQADALTVTNSGFTRVLVDRGVASRRIEVIPDWVDGDTFCPVARDEILAGQYGMGGRFNVVFAGTMGMAQRLEVVVDAAALLAVDGDVQFVLIGDGSCFGALRAYAQRLGVRNVLFLGRQPQERMASFFALADALLVHLRDDPLFSITIPSKTQAYLACGRPVIMAVRGDGARLVEEGRCGIACPPEDPRALAHAVRRLRGLSGTERRAMGEAGRRLYMERFSKPVLLGRMVERIRQVAREGSRHQ